MNIPQLNISRINAAQIPTEYGLSPSRVTYLAGGCPGCEMLKLKLAEAYKDNQEKYLTLTFHPSAPIAGNVLHRLANYCIGKTELDENEVFDLAEKYLKEEVDKLTLKWPMLKSLNIRFDFDKVSSLLDHFSAKNNNQNNTSFGRLYTERSLDCTSSLGLKGTPDYLWINGSDAEIRDYKTGVLTDSNGEIKESFCIQLNLYRLMVCQKYSDVHNVKMSIDNLSGCRVQIPQIGDKHLKDIVSGIRQDIQSEIFRSGDNCHKCQCGHICSQKEWLDPSSQEYFDFMGEIDLNNDAVVLTDRKRNITLNIARSDNSRELFYALKSMKGKTVYLTNLKKLSDDPLIGMLSLSTITCEIEK